MGGEEVEMPILRPEYQLSFELDIPEEEDKPGALSAEEVRLRSEAARQVLEQKRPGWYEDYEKLRTGGWPWRVAAYIAWASSPKASRPGAPAPGLDQRPADQCVAQEEPDH
jgi:hypothetical protein